MARLAQSVAAWCRSHDDEVTLIFDGSPVEEVSMAAGGNLAVTFAIPSTEFALDIVNQSMPLRHCVLTVSVWTGQARAQRPPPPQHKAWATTLRSVDSRSRPGMAKTSSGSSLPGPRRPVSTSTATACRRYLPCSRHWLSAAAALSTSAARPRASKEIPP